MQTKKKPTHHFTFNNSNRTTNPPKTHPTY